jgi:hypothetical protein
MSVRRATWEDGVVLPFRVFRRWFPWPTDNVTLGAWIFCRHAAINPPTLRHELTHVRQYHDRGWWWVLTHPAERERLARLAEFSTFPTWTDPT